MLRLQRRLRVSRAHAVNHRSSRGRPAADSKDAILLFAACNALPARCKDRSNCSSRSSVTIVIQLKNNVPKSLTQLCSATMYGSSQLRSYSNHSQDTGCTIMDDFMTKANDVFPTQTQIENLTLQPNGLNAQRVRATNKRRACATREDKNPDRIEFKVYQIGSVFDCTTTTFEILIYAGRTSNTINK